MVMEISFFKAMVITSIHINLRNFLYVIGIAATESAGKRADQSASAEKVEHREPTKPPTDPIRPPIAAPPTAAGPKTALTLPRYWLPRFPLR